MDLTATDSRDPFAEIFGTGRGSKRPTLEHAVGVPDVSTHEVICQKWSESESGWGQRPDGYSLHLTEEDRERFVKEYWDSMPDRSEGIPDCYTFPDGTAYTCAVDDDIFAGVQARDCGLRCSGPHPAGGKDGWLRVEEQKANGS